MLASARGRPDAPGQGLSRAGARGQVYTARGVARMGCGGDERDRAVAAAAAACTRTASWKERCVHFVRSTLKGALSMEVNTNAVFCELYRRNAALVDYYFAVIWCSGTCHVESASAAAGSNKQYRMSNETLTGAIQQQQIPICR